MLFVLRIVRFCLFAALLSISSCYPKFYCERPQISSFFFSILKKSKSFLCLALYPFLFLCCFTFYLLILSEILFPNKKLKVWEVYPARSFVNLVIFLPNLLISLGSCRPWKSPHNLETKLGGLSSQINCEFLDHIKILLFFPRNVEKSSWRC